MHYKVYGRYNFKSIPQLRVLNEEQIQSIDLVSRVLPFKTNNYVVNELINWDNFQEDPIFTLNFPRKEMLSTVQYNRLRRLIERDATEEKIKEMVNDIWFDLNPHPAGQLEHNVPTFEGKKLQGIQHKYREILLFFPSQGQTCHAYCTFCFRWPQFTGNNELKFSMKQADLLISYLKKNPEITDVLFTGGDPMVMKTTVFKKYIDAILSADLPQLKTIRIGTKSLSFWPYRFITDGDSLDMLDLFRQITDNGIHLAIMAHINHPQELSTGAAEEAIENIRGTGAQIRTQAPLLKHINDDASIWAEKWKREVELGMIPYYMFIARDTGAQAYFAVSLEEAWNIFRNAYNSVSGICRTVRGPSMSTGPGKVQVLGVVEIEGEKVFSLNFLQGRNPEWVGKPFYAKYNADALWLDDLQPAFGNKAFFFEKDYQRLLKIDKLPGHLLSPDKRQYA